MLAVVLLAACTATPRGHSRHPQLAPSEWRLTAEQQALAHANCYGGLPEGQATRGSTELIVRRGYVLEHSSRDKIPLWVCESDSAAQLQGHLKRHDRFVADPVLKGPRSLPSDYHDSGYERGHQAPAGNQTVDAALKDETFYMSNIAPQRPTLNSGIWNMLEQKTRNWVQRYGHAYEWTGPILCNESQGVREASCERKTIGNGVTVPEDFYKIILVQERGEWKAIAFVMPMILLLLFGYGVSLDIRHLPVAIVMESITDDTRAVFESFANSPYIRPVAMTDRRSAEEAVMRREVDGIVILRSDVTRRYRAGDTAAAQVLVNGIDANTARFVGAYARGAAATWLQQDLRRRGETGDAGVVVEQRVWFNPELRSTNFLVPGVIAIVMTLIGAMLTALVVAREWERGTMEAMMVSPASTAELLLGKLIAYFLLGMGGLAVALGLAVWLFEVPFRGSFGMLALVSAAFLLAMLGLGLLISTVARNQLVAAQVAFIVPYMPALMLSGFLFDIRSMPAVVQAITRIVPARYFVGSLQTLFLAGDVSAILLPNLLALGGFALLFFALTLRRSRRRLD